MEQTRTLQRQLEKFIHGTNKNQSYPTPKLHDKTKDSQSRTGWSEWSCKRIQKPRIMHERACHAK